MQNRGLIKINHNDLHKDVEFEDIILISNTEGTTSERIDLENGAYKIVTTTKENGKVVCKKEEFYRADGTLEKECMYEYDSNERELKSVVNKYDTDGQTLKSKSVKQTDWNNGKVIESDTAYFDTNIDEQEIITDLNHNLLKHTRKSIFPDGSYTLQTGINDLQSNTQMSTFFDYDKNGLIRRYSISLYDKTNKSYIFNTSKEPLYHFKYLSNGVERSAMGNANFVDNNDSVYDIQPYDDNQLHMTEEIDDEAFNYLKKMLQQSNIINTSDDPNKIEFKIDGVTFTYTLKVQTPTVPDTTPTVTPTTTPTTAAMAPTIDLLEAFEERIDNVFGIIWEVLAKSFGPGGAGTFISIYPGYYNTKDGFNIMKNLCLMNF